MEKKDLLLLSENLQKLQTFHEPSTPCRSRSDSFQYFSRNPDKKKEVYWNCSLVLEEVNIPDHWFVCLAYIEVWWKVDCPERVNIDALDHIIVPWNWEDLFHNAISEDTLTPAVHEWIEDDVIWGIYHSRVKLSANVDLMRFPFDRQCLDLRTTLDTKHYKILLGRPPWVPLNSPGLTTLGNNNNQLFQLRLNPILEKKYKLGKDPVVDFQSNNQGVLLLRICLQRRTIYYFTHVFLPIFCIVSAGIPAVSVPLEDAGDRLELSLTMFLVIVAFQYSIRDMLPETSETTGVDLYLLLTIFTSLGLIIENGGLNFLCTMISSDTEDDVWDNCRLADRTLYAIFTVFWIGLHLWIGCGFKGFRESWEKTLSRECGVEKWFPQDDAKTTFGENCGKLGYRFYEMSLLKRGKSTFGGGLMLDAEELFCE